MTGEEMKDKKPRQSTIEQLQRDPNDKPHEGLSFLGGLGR